MSVRRRRYTPNPMQVDEFRSSRVTAKGDWNPLIGPYATEQLSRARSRQARYRLWRGDQIIATNITYGVCLDLAGFGRVPWTDPRASSPAAN